MNPLITIMMLFTSLLNLTAALPALTAEGITTDIKNTVARTVPGTWPCQLTLVLAEQMPRTKDRRATVQLLIDDNFGHQIEHLTWDNGNDDSTVEKIIDSDTHKPTVHNIIQKGDALTLSWYHPDPEHLDTEWVDFLYTGGRFGTEKWINSDLDVGHAQCIRGNWTEDAKGGPNLLRTSGCTFKC